jgi:hypothetical protein
LPAPPGRGRLTRRDTGGPPARPGLPADVTTGGRRGLGVFAGALALTFLNFAAWSLATPLFASPDEPTQVAYAAAAVRGQVVGRTIGGDANATTGISIPEVFAGGPAYAACYAFHATVPASCAAPLPESTRTVRTTTYTGRYPPLYYFAVGWPSLVSVSETGIYLMRLVSALLNAVMVALALTSVALWSKRRLLLVGVAVAVTPMAWFLGGVLNPNGLEISAAVCLWTSGLVLVLDHANRPPAGLVAIVAGAACVLVQVRPLSALWAALVLAFLALVGGWRSVCALARSRAVRRAAVPVAACGLFAVVWVAAVHSLDLKPVGPPVPAAEDGLQLFGAVLERTGTWLQQMVGVFGWLDTNAPLLTDVVDGVLVAALAAAALRRPRRRRGGAAVLLLALVVVGVPVALVVSQAHRLGIDWQGRYALPLAVGVVLLCAALAAPFVPRLGLHVAAVAGAALFVSDSAAFLAALRRYAVGVTGPIDFLSGTWRPPGGLLLASVGGCAAIGALVVWVVAASRPRTDAGPVADAAGTAAETARDVRARRPRRSPARGDGATVTSPIRVSAAVSLGRGGERRSPSHRRTAPGS